MVLIYRTVAVLVFLLLLRQSTRHLMGSLILSIIWPALVPLMGYWAVKRYAFRLPPSKRYFELELLGGCSWAAWGSSYGVFMPISCPCDGTYGFRRLFWRARTCLM